MRTAIAGSASLVAAAVVGALDSDFFSIADFLDSHVHHEHVFVALLVLGLLLVVSGLIAEF